MTINVGNADRWIRIIVGLILLSLPLWLDAPWRWWGLIGIIPLATGLIRRCPAYGLLHINTCPIDKQH